MHTDDLPESAVQATRRTVGNVVALAVNAARHPAVERACAALERMAPPEQVRVLGRPGRIGATGAALLMGIAMHVEDYDDTHLDTVVHPGAPIVPAALVAAQWAGASGRDALTAAALGIEVALRVADGLGSGHLERGWHPTATVGHLGAAVTAGRLLGLDVEQMVVALGFAATQAAGLQEALGTMSKSFHPGKAAADGLEAAFLAAAGLSGPAAPIEGRRGLGELMTDAADYQRMEAGLGTRWLLEANTYKPYACGIVSHPVIDAAIALREQVADPSLLAQAELGVHPLVLQAMGIADPQDGLQSKFSVRHCFAVGLLDGTAGPEQYSDERARSPQVVALRRKVAAVTRDDVPKDATRLRATLTDGRVIGIHIRHATGSLAAPMTDAQLRHKARLLVEPQLAMATEAFLDQAFALDGLPDVDHLFTAADPEGMT